MFGINLYYTVAYILKFLVINFYSQDVKLYFSLHGSFGIQFSIAHCKEMLLANPTIIFIDNVSDERGNNLIYPL